MRWPRILLLSAAVLFTAASAAAGTLDFWEDSRGAQDVTAIFPTGPAQVAHIAFDASSAEAGGLSVRRERNRDPPDRLDRRSRLSTCEFHPCIAGATTSSSRARRATGGKLVVNDPDLDEKHGIHDLGTITFDGPAGAR